MGHRDGVTPVETRLAASPRSRSGGQNGASPVSTGCSVAEALQLRRGRGRELVKLSFPSRAPARGHSPNHDLFQIAGFRLGLRNLIRSDQAAAIEFVEVRACGRIAGIGSDAVPDVGSEAVLRDAAPIFECFGVEILRL